MTLLQLEKEIERLKKRVVELELNDRTVDVVSTQSLARFDYPELRGSPLYYSKICQ